MNTIKDTMDIREFDARLQRHDWHYSYSDDHSVYRNGKADEAQLDQLAQTSPNHDRLYRAYKAYQYTGGAERTAEQVLALKMTRISTGATTQEELDELARQELEREQEYQRAKEERAHEKALHKIACLDELNSLCNLHNWFYWRQPCESQTYREGSAERRVMINMMLTERWEIPELEQLFRAWANYANDSRRHVELTALQKQLGVAT